MTSLKWTRKRHTKRKLEQHTSEDTTYLELRVSITHFDDFVKYWNFVRRNSGIHQKQILLKLIWNDWWKHWQDLNKMQFLRNCLLCTRVQSNTIKKKKIFTISIFYPTFPEILNCIAQILKIQTYNSLLKLYTSKNILDKINSLNIRCICLWQTRDARPSARLLTTHKQKRQVKSKHHACSVFWDPIKSMLSFCLAACLVCSSKAYFMHVCKSVK